MISGDTDGQYLLISVDWSSPSLTQTWTALKLNEREIGTYSLDGFHIFTSHVTRSIVPQNVVMATTGLKKKRAI